MNSILCSLPQVLEDSLLDVQLRAVRCLCSSTSLKELSYFTLNKLLAPFLLSLIDSLYLVLLHTIYANLMSLAGSFVSLLLWENTLFLNET